MRHPDVPDAAADRSELEGCDFGGLRAALTLTGFVADALSLLEIAVAIHFDLCVMHKQIPSTVIGGDEAVPLLGREPFHDTFSHFESVLRIRGPGIMPGPNLQKLS